jgi:hypothetical protein
MAPFAVQLSKTAPIGGRAVAPIAEWVARAFGRPSLNPTLRSLPDDQGNKRQAKGVPSFYRAKGCVHRRSVGCRKNIAVGRMHCAQCSMKELQNG